MQIGIITITKRMRNSTIPVATETLSPTASLTLLPKLDVLTEMAAGVCRLMEIVERFRSTVLRG